MPGNSMVQTRSNQFGGNRIYHDSFTAQLEIISERVDSLLSLKNDIVAIREAWLARPTHLTKEPEDEPHGPLPCPVKEEDPDSVDKGIDVHTPDCVQLMVHVFHMKKKMEGALVEMGYSSIEKVFFPSGLSQVAYEALAQFRNEDCNMNSHDCMVIVKNVSSPLFKATTISKTHQQSMNVVVCFIIVWDPGKELLGTSLATTTFFKQIHVLFKVSCSMQISSQLEVKSFFRAGRNDKIPVKNANMGQLIWLLLAGRWTDKELFVVPLFTFCRSIHRHGSL